MTDMQICDLGATLALLYNTEIFMYIMNFYVYYKTS